MPNAQVATFHGFFSAFLRREAHAIGIHDGLLIMSPKDEILIARNILRPILMAHIEQEDSLVRSLVARFRLNGGQRSVGLMDGLLAIYSKLPEQGLLVEDLLVPPLNRDMARADINNNINDIERCLNEFQRIKSSTSTMARLDDIKRIWLNHKQLFSEMMDTSYRKAFVKPRNSIKGNFGDIKARSALVSAVVKLGANLVDYFMRADEEVVIRILGEFHADFEQFKRKASMLSYADLLLKTRLALGEDGALRRRTKKKTSPIFWWMNTK